MKREYEVGMNRKKAHAKWVYLANLPLIRKGFKSITLDCVKIIQVLEEEGELKRSKIIEKTGIPRGNIDRRLNHLRAIEAIYLNKRKYQAARARAKERIEISNDTMVSHSRHLIPALRQIARIETSRYATKEGEYINEQDMRLLIDCARSHLRYYPDLSKLIDRRAGIEENAELMEEDLRLDLFENLKKKFNDETIVNPDKGIKCRSFIGSNIPSQICNCLLYGKPAQVKLEDEKILFGNLIAKGSHLLNGVREFVNREIDDMSNIEVAKRIEKALKSAFAIGLEIERETRKIILGIESDIPLLGGCEMCSARGKAF